MKEIIRKKMMVGMKECGLCGGTKTYINKKGIESWHNSKWGIICKRCFERTPERRKYMQKVHDKPEIKQRAKEYEKIRIRNKKIKLLSDTQSTKRARISLKKIIVDNYSKGKNCCNCCGVTGLIFLTVDHINNDGAKHRKEIKAEGLAFYRWIVKHKFPDGFQVLCWNCNWAKYFNKGVCPHEK